MTTTPQPQRPTLAVIAALDRQGAIGRGGALLWQEREDLAHFRRVTIGCPVIMGRKTWDSLPGRFKPLPGRRNVVVTRDAQWLADGAERAASLDAALALLADAAKVFVIGGGELFALAMPRADELVLTEIDAAFDGADTHFPAFDRAAFAQTAHEPRIAADGTRYAFVTYRRVPTSASPTA
jgi:dihydrofolate reductase